MKAIFKRGFTLIELLAVIAIIGVLVSIISVSVNASKQKGRDARRVADIASLRVALQTYYNDNSVYPDCIYNSDASCVANSFEGTYMSKTPLDPGTGNKYSYTASKTGSAGAPCNFYHLGAIMEDSTNRELTQDVDLANANSNNNACTTNKGVAKYDGNATNCSGSSAAATDLCYDQTP